MIVRTPNSVFPKMLKYALHIGVHLNYVFCVKNLTEYFSNDSHMFCFVLNCYFFKVFTNTKSLITIEIIISALNVKGILLLSIMSRFLFQ